MKITRKNWNNILWSLVFPIAIFILLKNTIDKILIHFLINPIFSNVYPASWHYDIAIAIILLSITIPLAAKISKNDKIPIRWLCIFFTFLFVYLTYRIPNEPFNFTPLSFSNRAKLMDQLFIIPIIAVSSGAIFKKKKNQNQKNQSGFIVDEATAINPKDDLFNRSRFVKEIAEKIKNTSSPNGSFPIGVVASWGSGKTTFLNTLKSEFNSSNYIAFEFNAWKYSNSNQIIEMLFKTLREQLKEYSFAIDNRLQEYVNNLLKGAKEEGLNSIKNISEIFFPTQSIEKQYEIINEEIKKIDKKIIILIDDLDRLDKKEVYEVIRLIRNTANFSNTFFIVAYDRNYILNSLEEVNAYRAHLFLEKIFQLEFTLPPISEKVIRSEISKRIESFLTAKGQQGHKYLLKKEYNFYEYGDADLTNLFIHNMRDVVRFINSFKLNYQFVKDEVYFPDFYNLELIRFKHPELFLSIYAQRHILLTTEKEKNYASNYGNTYSLKIKPEDDKSGKGDTALKKYIATQTHIYKLSSAEIDTICLAYSSIFPNSGSMVSSRVNGIDGHLTVLKPSMLDRYFVLGLDGKLSEIEFSKMRSLSVEEFKSKLTTLSIEKDLINDILERFEAIQDFDNKEDFEKIITGIFHFANLYHPDKQERRYSKHIGYNGESLANILGRKRTLAMYTGKADEYKHFLLSFFRTNLIEYTYTNDFVSSLIQRNHYFLNSVFSSEDISEILLQNFKEAIKRSKSFSLELWWHFRHCETRHEIPIDSNSWRINHRQIKEAADLMKEFIWSKDIDGFILFSISQVSFEKNLTIENTLIHVFGSNEAFISELSSYSGETKYKLEFLSFYEALTTNEEYKKTGVPLNFFKIIPVNTRIHSD